MIVEHIKKVKGKPLEVRKQYLWIYLVSIMVVIFAVFILDFTHSLTKKVADNTTKDAIKPLQIFGNMMKDTIKLNIN